jgi:hypothetical protein
LQKHIEAVQAAGAAHAAAAAEELAVFEAIAERRRLEKLHSADTIHMEFEHQHAADNGWGISVGLGGAASDPALEQRELALERRALALEQRQQRALGDVGLDQSAAWDLHQELNEGCGAGCGEGCGEGGAAGGAQAVAAAPAHEWVEQEDFLAFSHAFSSMSLTQKAYEQARKKAGDRSAAENGSGWLRELCEAGPPPIHAQDQKGRWYPARIIAKPNPQHPTNRSRVRVHYINFHKRHDEWVPADRIRVG